MDVSSEQFTQWVRDAAPALSRLVALYGLEDRDAVMQESLTQAWRKRRLYDPERGSPRSWLLAIAADQARQDARRRKRRRDVVVWAQDAAMFEPEPDVELYSAIRRLTDRQRLAIGCYYFGDLSIEETSRIMRCSVGTVKSTLFAARAQLRARLELTDDSRRE